jgi:hypothetical protein
VSTNKEKRHISVEEEQLEPDWIKGDKSGQRDTSPRKSKKFHRTTMNPEP